MSPRGVAIPDIRERLFTAAEEVLTREGPGALTSRAITGEAGCAKGMLHAHFAGLDEFVAELVLDRFARAAHQAEDLQHRVGRATVPENLHGVALALLSSAGPTLAGLALTRPGAAEQIRQALAAGAPGFAAVQDAITSYLDREQQHGRLPTTTDSPTVALALVGTVHHLLMTGQSGSPDAHDQIERLTTLLTATGPG
ncbi:TetR/AcrR family transcriptional regulator [Kitasatospora sp. P5_F3]